MSKTKSAFHDYSTRCGLGDDAFLSLSQNRVYNQLKNLALNVYRWDDLPEPLESRYVEEALYENGEAFTTYEPTNDLGYIALPSNPTNGLNLYGDPTAVTVTGVGFSKVYQITDGVRILNNDSALATKYNTMYYATKIDDVERTIEKNLNQQRNPYFYRTTKENEFSIKALAKSIENDEVGIFIDKELASKTDGAFVKEEIWRDFRALDYNKLKLEYRKEYLSLIGLNTVINKDSGMSTDEVNSNNGEIELELDIGYKSRLIACKAINEKYGLNVKVVKVIKELQDTLAVKTEEVDNG